MALPTNEGSEKSKKLERPKFSPGPKLSVLQKRKPSVINRTAAKPNHNPVKTVLYIEFQYKIDVSVSIK